MSKKIITVDNLGKMYYISQQGQNYETIREKLLSIPARITGKVSEKKAFWAIKNISFEINEGDRVGIIGSNGAGKSTLLKLLSRITKPTLGYAVINGRVASLLEVGTGFHPELTGRENINLNGALLGMNRAEIRKKFDEIVDFSGVEKFIDTPVKRYSSGMYVRLAFAIAAHLEPEILIVDEVLAVGDAEFQKKCLGKMEDVSTKGGRTVLFVSHNMDAIKKLCGTGLLFHDGTLISTGNMDSVLDQYLKQSDSDLQAVFDLPKPSNLDEIPGYAYKLQIEDQNGKLLTEIPIGTTWQVRIFIELTNQVKHMVVGLGMQTLHGTQIRTSRSQPLELQKGFYEAVFKETSIIFSPGRYQLLIWLSEHKIAFQNVTNLLPIQFVNGSNAVLNQRIVIPKKQSIFLNQMEVEFRKT